MDGLSLIGYLCQITRYVEFDFHEQCRGMKYENIDRLIKSLEVPIQELGYCWLAPRNDGIDRADDASFERLYEQKGVIRTNCMDCLDRTNVVQSAVGRHILNHQLLRLGIASFPDKGLSVYEDFENVFNHVWANNGDAISREYAGTSALKGDFTRTGKRNLQGMVNDATNSIARMYQNTFKDYFRQAAIDYLLGKAGVDVFRNLQTTAFGTVVVPPPILPPVTEQQTRQQIQSSASESALPSLLLAQDGNTSAGASQSVGLLPSLIPMDQSQQEASLGDEKSEEAWVRVREAAIETSAEIVISPGEERWKGWTFICSSNEISSALTSASSPYSSPKQHSKRANSSASASPLRKKSAWSKVIPLVDSLESKKSDTGKEEASPVFYDEKIVLLTEKALYICTYDYEMEKVLEFWRLALEKMTGIDKGAYFVTAQDSSRLGQDPLENYGFAVIYRASAAGETLRVNSGSVRNRRMMGVQRTPLAEATDLELVQEEEAVDDEGKIVVGEGSNMDASGFSGVLSEEEDGRSAKSILKGEAKDLNTVRFKIVKHPETSIVPFVSSSSTSDSTGLQKKANPSGYKRTAQDCVEWVVTEIVQARCELISVAEKGFGSGPAGLETPPPPGKTGLHGASPSEEYTGLQSAVQVDLMIRDRVLQSLEVAAQLEAGSLKGTSLASAAEVKKSKKSFSSFFTSSLALNKATLQQQQQQHPQPQEPMRSSLLPPQLLANNNKSWLKKFSFGNTSGTDDDFEDSDEEDTLERRQRRRFRKPVTKDSGPSLNTSETQGLVTAAAAEEAHLKQKQQQQEQSRQNQAQAQNGVDSSVSSLDPSIGQPLGGQRNSGGVFAKFKQAVKNF